MWNTMELSNDANSGQDGCRMEPEIFPEGEKHTISKLPAVINQQMPEEQVCMSEFWGQGR